MPSMTIAALIAATVGGTILLINLFPQGVEEHFFRPIDRARLLLGIIILAVGAWTLLNSGVAWMMGIALVGFAFVTALFYYDQPHQDIR